MQNARYPLFRDILPRFVLVLTVAALPLRGDETREDAVAAAGEGQLEDSMVVLRKLLAINPADPLTAFDLAIIYTWNNQPAEAISVFEQAKDAEPPEYVLAPMIRAYRDQKHFSDAERLARQGTKRFSLDQRWPALLALILTDQSRPEDAIALLKPWAAKYPDDAQIWLALGYAYFSKGDRFETLRTYGQALRLRPRNQEAAGAMADVMAELGAPYAAGSLLPETPWRVQASQAALMVRWGGHVVSLDPRHRFDGTDAALRRLDALLEKARKERTPDAGLIIRLRRDRIVALRQRERWADAVAEAQELREQGDVIPPYAREAEADALLALRRPREARLGYEEVLQADPQRREAHIGRFFSFVEEEKFRKAFAEIDALAASNGPALRQPGQHLDYPNWEWLEGQALSAEARLFADMPGSAWRRLRPLAEGAPANADLRRLLGDAAAARGWPRRSDEEIHIASSLEPQDRGVQIALAESALRRLRWREARQRIADLSELYPEDMAVRRTRLDLAAHDSWELFSEFHYHFEPANAESETDGFAPGTGYDIITRLYSPPLAEYWRIILGFEYHEAQVLEGTAQRYREGVGFDLRLPDFALEAMFWYNNGSLSQPGGSLAASWSPTDHWTFRGEAEIFAADTPLRAVLSGITANMAGGGIQYDWNESRSLALGAQWYGFSDGNDRYAIDLAFAQKVLDIPRFDLTVRPALYTSHNESDNVPYFSPLYDFSATVGLDAEHVIWRHYESSFGQRLVVSAGSYWQDGFGTGWIGSILYEQVYRHDPRAEIRYGVQGNRNIYDGVMVPSLDFFVRINLLF